MIATPLIGALVVFVTPKSATALQRLIAWVISAINVVLAGVAVSNMQPTAGYQLVDRMSWFPEMDMQYAVGMDGINMWMVVLTTLLLPLGLWAARQQEGASQRAFYALMLALSGALIGAFVATDILLFYVFFELTLIPTAILVALYGNQDRRAAAVKFFVYPFVGSVFMLMSIAGLVMGIAQQTGVMTFDTASITAAVREGAVTFDPLIERLLFAGFFLAFAIKTPIWPFHTWMPQTQAATPDHGAVDIAGLLLKLGAFGFLRFAIPFFPNASAWAAPAIGILAVIGIIYAGIVAFAQNDLKLVLSYATISHLGFVVLGIFSGTVEGISGALVTMINSGLTTGALFLMVGILARARGSRQVGDFGGVWSSAPKFGSLALVTVFASIGVPGLNGFIGEYLALQGTWLSANLGFGYAAFAVLGVIVSAAYLLHMYRTVFMGATPEGHTIAEANRGDLIVMTVLVLAMLVVGMYPAVVLEPIQASVADLVSSVTVAPLP